MKRFLSLVVFILLLLLFTSSSPFAQSGKVPPFQMVQANGKIFRAQNLPMGKPILLVYFSPECDHCEKMLKAFFGQAAHFQKASVALITFLPVEKVAKFVTDYNLAKHPNMYAGTEGNTFFVRNYYRVKELPFVALYTKNGDFVASFEKDINLAALAEKLKQLQ
jgi:thioredoxin-related protein